MAYLLAGKYETAAALLRQRIILVPETDFSRAVLASALGHLGEVDEARRIWRELKEINPKYSFSETFRPVPNQCSAPDEKRANLQSSLRQVLSLLLRVAAHSRAKRSLASVRRCGKRIVPSWRDAVKWPAF